TKARAVTTEPRLLVTGEPVPARIGLAIPHERRLIALVMDRNRGDTQVGDLLQLAGLADSVTVVDPDREPRELVAGEDAVVVGVEQDRGTLLFRGAQRLLEVLAVRRGGSGGVGRGPGRLRVGRGRGGGGGRSRGRRRGGGRGRGAGHRGRLSEHWNCG